MYKFHVDFMEKNGYVIIPVPWMTPKEREKVRKDMMKTIKTFPEYTHISNTYVLGGFRAFNNPASFHNEFVRTMRMCAIKELIPFFKEYVKTLPNPKKWKLEQVVDRLMYRPKGVSATAESWHRDEAPLAKDSDKILGGWWNFNDFDQEFSCVPKTHKSVRGHYGFAAIKDKELKKKYNKEKIKVIIPPGSIIVFYEHLVHEVLAKKSKQDIYRLFLGWRLTKSSESLYFLDNKLRDQAVMPLKSNQIPRMYASLHWTHWRDKIVDFTRNIKNQCVESKRVKSGKDKGKIYDIVHVNMKSLKEYGFPLYNPYIKEEIEILKPNRIWKLKCGEIYKEFNL